MILMLGGMGQRGNKPVKEAKETGDVAPSNKVQLIKGEIPKYKGDVKVSLELDTEPIVVTIYGAPGLGKTHNAFTFPDPAICDTEMKGEKVWRKFWLGQCQGYRIAKDGSIQPYTWDQSVITLEKSRLSHAEDWGEVASFFDHYAQDPDIQTLVYDSESDLREMAEAWTLGETGKKTLYGGESGGTKAYSLAFGKLRYILFNAKRYGKNLVYCAKVKDEYVNDKKTTRQIHDGYSKQFFYSGYVIKLRLGVVNSSGEVLYKRHVFGEVEKAENMRPGYYPPYLVDPSYKGIMEGLVRGSEWTQGVDAFIRDVIDPAMKEKGVVR